MEKKHDTDVGESQLYVDGMEFTGSAYEGASTQGRMQGHGKYMFPNGSWYEGGMKDGQFHGHGKLHFTNGQIFEADWENGRSVGPGSAHGTLTFDDGLVFEEKNWDYCDEDDRRFYSERIGGIQPAGKSQLTNSGIVMPIPSGCYDVGDGYYCAERGEILSYSGAPLRKPTHEEAAWAVQHCRQG
eukprot:m.574804 g.574804  ORF g.574804 m.574804 type:complete len:185 (+) comp22284_c0_seq4:148-702(+)